MANRSTRIWQDSLAHATVYEGDATECSKWIGWAKQKLQFMLHSTSGPLTATFAPADTILIRVDTRPNRIFISAQAGVVPTVGIDPDIDSRRFYLAVNKSRVKEPYKTGGYAQRIDGLGADLPGGSWTNGKRAVSWTANSIYIDGLPLPLAGITEIGSRDIIQAATVPSTNPAYTTIVYAIVSPRTGSTKEHRLVTVGVLPLPPAAIELSGESLSYWVVGTYTTGRYQLTGFDSTVSKFGILLSHQDTVSTFTTIRQEIILFSSTTEWTAHTETVIYDELVQYALIEDDDTGRPPFSPDVRTVTRDVTLQAGSPRIVSLKMDSTSLGAFCVNAVSYSYNSTLTESPSGIDSTGSGAYQIQLTLQKIPFTGATPAPTTVDTINWSEAYARSFTPGEGGVSVSVNDTSNIPNITLVDFSARLGYAIFWGEVSNINFTVSAVGDPNTSVTGPISIINTYPLKHIIADGTSQILVSPEEDLSGTSSVLIPPMTAGSDGGVDASSATSKITTGNVSALPPAYTALANNDRILVSCFADLTDTATPRTLVLNVLEVASYLITAGRDDVVAGESYSTRIALARRP